MFLKAQTGFDFWVLRLRDLGAPFSSFGCFVFSFFLSFQSTSIQDCSQPRSQGSLLSVPTEGRRENLGTRLDYSLVEFNR